MPLTPTRRAEIAFGAGLLGLVLVAAFASEGVLRVREAMRVNWAEMNEAIMFDDPDYGFARFRPNTTFDNISVNALGLPSPDLVTPKPDNALRIAFLGDSTFLGASLRPADTLPALLTAEVARAFPSCAVDWISISGPAYGLSDIRVVLAEVQPVTRPDAFVIMAGGMRETLKDLEASVNPQDPYFRDRTFIESHSLLLTKLRRAYTGLETARDPADDDLFERLDINLFAEIFRKKFADIAALIGDAPTVIVENRGRERDTTDDAALAVLKRSLLADLNGLGVSGLRNLSAVTRDLQATQSDVHGWQYIDPLAAIPPTDRFFEDPVHLTSDGTHTVTPTIAQALIAQIKSAAPDLPCLQ